VGSSLTIVSYNTYNIALTLGFVTVSAHMKVIKTNDSLSDKYLNTIKAIKAC